MRAQKLALICLLAGSAVLQLPGCASFDQPATPVVVDDAALAARVKSAITNEAGPGTAMNVNVASSAGTVLLTGFVDSDQSSLRTEQIARSIEGVRAVRNELNTSQRTRYVHTPATSSFMQ